MWRSHCRHVIVGGFVPEVGIKIFITLLYCLCIIYKLLLEAIAFSLSSEIVHIQVPLLLVISFVRVALWHW